LNGKAFRIASAAMAGASFSSARMIVTARFIVVRSGTSECGFFSVGQQSVYKLSQSVITNHYFALKTALSLTLSTDDHPYR
jgi:hypothetical protein